MTSHDEVTGTFEQAELHAAPHADRTEGGDVVVLVNDTHLYREALPLARHAVHHLHTHSGRHVSTHKHASMHTQYPVNMNKWEKSFE